MAIAADHELETPASDVRGFTALDAPSPDILNKCVHCGLCLPACPTFRETGLESSSPRGRIHLIRAVHTGRLGIDDPVFVHQMHECLVCRACEPACPSGVEYGQLVEAARAQVEQTRPEPPPLEGLARLLTFQVLFTDLGRFRLFSRLIQAYQRSGLRHLARASGVLSLIGMQRLDSFLPPVARRFLTPGTEQWAPRGAPRARVALLAGCIMSTAYANIDRATARVLAANGCEVIVPEGQGCCGALHVHAGNLNGGRALARANIDAFERLDVDAIIINAAGCGAQLKEYGHLLHNDPVYAQRAAAFSARVRDITEYLASIELNPAMGSLPLRVTYQEPCHLAHAQRISQQPRALLRQIPGLTLVEMQESALCCGSAGIYNVVQPAMSDALGERKVRHALATGAEVVVSANPGCMIQVQANLKKVGSPVRVRHIVELLDDAYAARQ
ncbi:MAG: 4Fe-4S dicluster domain-containing protein [Chloroflexi bacterium]|nr:4Fe-4S dicluster domain-containing protein [Chloroflexota bacterium]